MFKLLAIFPCLLFISATCNLNVKKFTFEDHDYLCFDCKAVLHDPECHKCRFRQFVMYDLYDLHYQIIELKEVSPFRN